MSIVTNHKGPDESVERRLRQRQELETLTGQLQLRMGALWDPADWSDVELTMPQLRALHLLVHEPRRMSEIAGSLGTSMQATTSLIDRLVDKDLVERVHDSTDRRVVICRLTPAGMVEMRRFYQMGQARLDLLVDLLTDDELTTVISAFETLSAAAQRRIDANNAAATGPRPTRTNINENTEPLS